MPSERMNRVNKLPIEAAAIALEADDTSALEHERAITATAVAQAQWHAKVAAAYEKLAHAVSGARDLNALSQQVLDLVVDVANVELGLTFVRMHDQFRPLGAVGIDHAKLSAAAMPADAPLVAKIAGTRDTLLLTAEDVERDGREVLRELGLRSGFCLPLCDERELVGFIALGPLDETAFGDAELHLVSTLVTQTGQAIVARRELENARQAIAARDEVLAVVAHDLRNPINVIGVAAHGLQQRLTDAPARRSVERILRGAQRAEHLIRDLLEVQAIETGRFSIARRPIETASTLLAAIESQQSLAADASVILATDLSPDLPSVDADDERLCEVLENLIGNAIKFTPAGGTVTVGATRKEDEVLVWVKDTGSGITPEQLPHLFDRFWQARKRDRRGTGLGLTICKAIVEAHGGRIWAVSAAGTGTTMFFTVPANLPSLKAPGRLPTVANVLIVDDRPENLLALTAILERPDYRLITASSGTEALSLALREDFAVALIDVAMPGMSGLEVAANLKALERCREVPIIFITAFGDDPQEVHRAYSAGGADYLVKPLDAEIVRKKVAVFVALSRRRLETLAAPAAPTLSP